MAKNNSLPVKMEDLKRRRPELRNIDWSRIVREEPEVFNSIANGLVRANEGRKSKLDNKTGTGRFNQLKQTDFSEKEFKEAFAIMSDGETVRATADKIGVCAAHVHNLKKGKAEPTLEIMEAIASAYDKRPEFFIEYRVAKVLGSIGRFLTHNPETATTWFNKFEKSKGINIK